MHTLQYMCMGAFKSMTQPSKHQLLSGLYSLPKPQLGEHEAETTTRPHWSWFPTIRIHHSSTNWWRIRTERGLASRETAIWFLWCNCQRININEPCHLKGTLWLNERGEIVGGCKSYFGTCMISYVCVRAFASLRVTLTERNVKAIIMINVKTSYSVKCLDWEGPPTLNCFWRVEDSESEFTHGAYMWNVPAKSRCSTHISFDFCSVLFQQSKKWLWNYMVCSENCVFKHHCSSFQN